MKKAIYAASLDPITYGHIDLIKRALNVFDCILVAIGVNETKKPLFSLEKREAMAKKELSIFGDRVIVKSFNGMLSDFAYMNNITTIIRGARSTPDFDYEKLLGDINRYSGVDTIIYTSIPRLSHISSSAAKTIALNVGENILDYVSLDIKRRLEEELLYQYRIGITGIIGSGKSYVAKMFNEYYGCSYGQKPILLGLFWGQENKLKLIYQEFSTYFKNTKNEIIKKIIKAMDKLRAQDIPCEKLCINTTWLDFFNESNFMGMKIIKSDTNKIQSPDMYGKFVTI